MSVERVTVQDGSPAAGRHLHWPGYRLHCSPTLDWALSSTLSLRLALTQQTDRQTQVAQQTTHKKKKSVVMKYRHVDTFCYDVICCAI